MNKMRKIIALFLFSAILALSGCSSAVTTYYNQSFADESWYAGLFGVPAGGEDTTDTLNEQYSEYIENAYFSTLDMPVSTFSTDVDTASYSNIRRILNDGTLPTAYAVRIEEMINYFTYDLEGPDGDDPVKITTELSVAPWNEDHQLLMVGLKTSEIEYDETTGNNLVFLLDVSGSMSSSDKLPLLKSAIKLLVDVIRPSDRISIVVYAGSSGVVLEAADSNNKDDIIEALDNLQAGGSTAGGAGIELAYQIAEKYYIEGGNNRIILGTDGDFNVGISNTSDLEDFIAEKKESGVFLSVLGFGTGNIRDGIMETLADKGNGVYYYIDTYQEAQKVFVNELGGTMVTVAKDVKLQIEFNPLNVKGYRLIGYENRVLNYEDFNDDTKDAGDLGSGHEVIAFYELIPAGSDEEINPQDYEVLEDLKYDGENYSNELTTISIRYKEPTTETSELIQDVVLTSDYTDSPSETYRFASAVAEFGMLLIQSQYKGASTYNQVIQRAENALGTDEFGYRDEFLDLVSIAFSLSD